MRDIRLFHKEHDDEDNHKSVKGPDSVSPSPILARDKESESKRRYEW